MRAQEILKRVFGYDQFRPLQEEIVSHVLGGQDAFVLMPTGGGKSLCYQLPALMVDGLTLVISPLISLMKDQVDSLQEAGVECAYLNSSIPAEDQRAIERDAMRGRLKILYLAPERIASLTASGVLDNLRVSLIAVDEAHCISEWGHDFRPEYRQLANLRRTFPRTPVIALTATATSQVRDDIVKHLRLERARLFTSSFNRPNLTYAVRPKQRAKEQLIALLKENPDESAIVYCFSRNGTEELALELQRAGIVAQAYHAGLSPNDRNAVQDGFIRDRVRVVVATIAFGMGIDKPDVRLVVHFDLPKSIESYYQETGRAGRDNLPARCVLFYTIGDRRKHMFFISQMKNISDRNRAIAMLDQVVAYGKQGICRRAFLLRYFGETLPSSNCGSCDTCNPSIAPVAMIERPRRAESNGFIADQDLFQKLRAARKRLADERSVPAYVIFGDRTLQEMADRKPQTLEAMADIFGVGAKKLEQFGQTFLFLIKTHR